MGKNLLLHARPKAFFAWAGIRTISILLDFQSSPRSIDVAAGFLQRKVIATLRKTVTANG